MTEPAQYFSVCHKCSCFCMVLNLMLDIIESTLTTCIIMYNFLHVKISHWNWSLPTVRHAWIFWTYYKLGFWSKNSWCSVHDNFLLILCLCVCVDGFLACCLSKIPMKNMYLCFHVRGMNRPQQMTMWSPKILHKVAIEILSVWGLSIVVEEPIYLLLIT